MTNRQDTEAESVTLGNHVSSESHILWFSFFAPERLGPSGPEFHVTEDFVALQADDASAPEGVDDYVRDDRHDGEDQHEKDEQCSSDFRRHGDGLLSKSEIHGGLSIVCLLVGVLISEMKLARIPRQDVIIIA